MKVLLLLLASADLGGLIGEYLRSPTGSEAETAAVQKIGVYWEADRALVEQAVTHHVSFPAAESGLRTEKLALMGFEDDETVPSENRVAIWIPKGYDPAKRWPALMVVHATMGLADAEVRALGPFADRHGYILIGPQDELNLGGGGWGYTDYQREIHAQALRHVKRRYNVDDDRVFVHGVSRGGHASWDLAYTGPDLFAGAIPVVGGPKLRYFRFLPNLLHVPILDMQGAKDHPLMVEYLRDAVKKLEGLKYDVTYLEDAESGHYYPIDWDQVAEWMGARRRDPYPKKIVRIAVRDDQAAAYWIRPTGLPAKRFANVKPATYNGRGGPLTRDQQKDLLLKNFEKYRARVAAEVEGNVVDLTISKSPKVVVSLSDRLVDLDEKVTFRVNGRVRKKALVPRSLETMLRRVKATGDRSMLYSAEVTIRGVR